MDNINQSWVFESDPTNQYAYQHNFLTKQECESIIKSSTQHKIQQAVVGTTRKVGTIRNSNVRWLSPDKETKWLYKKLSTTILDLNKQFFKFDITGLLEGLQFTSYKYPGGKYGKHIDQIFGGIVRKLSISVQLTDPAKYKGGELCLHVGHKPIVLPKTQGSFYMFPSYIVQELKPLTKGESQSLVALVNGKPFK